MNARATRREELQLRCQHQRNEIIASTAATLARLPKPRDLARWMRFARRLLRDIHGGAEHARE